ncbi:MAG: insulinase family protein [Firmicutes bacterium]|nr:insulinase family protein [Bacillota bacterium]
MKKLLSLLLALALLFSAAGCTSSDQPKDNALADLPQAGDVVEGFAVKDVRDFPLVGAKLVMFEHEKTGAELMYIANNDTNRVFDLTFFTRAVDNTGLPHVFEHSTLDGSEKYPSKALFFNLSYQTYNTYMNAMTGSLYTTYPVASLSEEQLLQYADYYTDSCLHPMILEDESIFREEAWRYRMDDEDSDLTIEGTVYSEMQGADDLSRAAYYNVMREAFPGSIAGNDSGGEPASIPDMTWDALKDYHEEYYHPSNCVAFLYGEFEDYAAFLKLLDEAFSPYEKREFTFEDAEYEPLRESVTKELAFPVESGSGTDNSSEIYYAFLCPGLKDDPQEEVILNTLTDLLVADASPLMQSLKKAIPSGTFASYIEIEGPEDMIVFYAGNVNPEDAETFRSTVDDSLKDVAANGFAEDLVDGVMSALSLDMKLVRESSEVGVSLVTQIADYYASTGAAFGYMDYVEGLEKIASWNSEGLYAKAVDEWLLNAVTAMSVTFPEPGLREKLDAAENSRLADVRAAMSEEEIQAIIAASNAEDEEDDASGYVKALQAVTVESLPEEIRTYSVSDTNAKDGTRRINVQADVDGVGKNILFLDASGLSQMDIHWFALYCSVVGQMDTSQHTREELAVLMTRYLHDSEIRLSLIDQYGTKEFTPYLRAGWTAADEDLAKGYELMDEILYETDFSDAETLLGLVSQAKASLKSSINNAPYNAMLYRAFGKYSPLYRYYSYFNSIEFYQFLEETEQDLEKYPAVVQIRLEAVRDYFHNRANAVNVYAGSKAGVGTNTALADGFFANLDDNAIEPVTYEFPEVADSEALIVDSTVQYNGIVADFETMGTDGYSSELDALSNLIGDAYLYPNLRDQYGAYGVWNGFLEDAGCYVVSYRDPNIVQTFDVYEALPAFLRDQAQDQETLDGYILSAYSNYALSEGELAGAVDAALSSFSGKPLDAKLQYMRELKTLTPEKVKACADIFEAFVEDGMRFTAGGAGAINANADLYEKILNPFGAVDRSAMSFEDLPEGSEYYDAVYFAIDNAYMRELSETVFGVDEEATVADMAYALYSLGFGEEPADLDTARSDLGEYGIMASNGANSDAITANGVEDALASFSRAIGLTYQRGEGGDEPLTRGQLAVMLMEYVEPLLEE